MTTRIASTTWPPASSPHEAQAFADVDDVTPPPPLVAPPRFTNIYLWAAAAALLLSLIAWIGVLAAEMFDHSDDLELAATPTVTVLIHTHRMSPTSLTADAGPVGFVEGFAAGYCDSTRRFGLTGPRPGCPSKGSVS